MLLHAGHDDQVQRLMIALQPGSYVRPHRHAEQWELLALFRGVGQVLSFDNHGRIVDRIEMTTVSPVVQIPIGTWHGFLVLELNTIIMEIKPGPYRANEFADWAPPEGDASVADYLRDWRSSLRTAETE